MLLSPSLTENLRLETRRVLRTVGMALALKAAERSAEGFAAEEVALMASAARIWTPVYREMRRVLSNYIDWKSGRVLAPPPPNLFDTKEIRSAYEKALPRLTEVAARYAERSLSEGYAQAKRWKPNGRAEKEEETQWKKTLADILSRNFARYTDERMWRSDALAEEVQRLVGWMVKNESTRIADLAITLNRVDRAIRLTDSFEIASNLTASRAFQFGALEWCVEQQIDRYIIHGILDARQCRVCLRMHGRVFDTQRLVEKRDAYLARGADIEAERQLFPWPKPNEVDNMSPQAIAQSEFICPPFHPRCRCVIQPLESSRTGRGQTPSLETIGPLLQGRPHPVASRFRNPDLVELYLKYEAEYREWMDELLSPLTPEDYKLMQRFLAPLDARPYSSAAAKKAVEKLVERYIDDIGPYLKREVLKGWQSSTNIPGPLRFKTFVMLTEDHPEREAALIFIRKRSQSPEQAATLFEKYASEARDNIKIENYLRLRAFNQVFMQKIYGDAETIPIPLLRGTGGRTGEKLKEMVINAKEQGVTTAILEDEVVAGYTSDSRTAASFGKNTGGITVTLKDVPMADVIVHESLLGGITRAYMDEREWLVYGGKRVIPIGDIQYKTGK